MKKAFVCGNSPNPHVQSEISFVYQEIYHNES